MTKDILLVGSARVKITPKIGITLSGYYNVRVSEGVLDDLYLNAVAFKQGVKKYCVISAGIVAAIAKPPGNPAAKEVAVAVFVSYVIACCAILSIVERSMPA